jgi:hypothetical protein
MVYASQLWRTLATSEQVLWAAYALTVILTNSLGQTYTPTPSQCFTWFITMQQICGISPLVLTAPTSGGMPIVPAHTLAFSGNNLQVTAVNPAPAAGEKYLFRLFRADFVRTFPRTHLFLRSVFDGATALPWTIGTNYKNSIKTGTYARGHVWYRLLDTGLRSTVTTKTYIDFTAT